MHVCNWQAVKFALSSRHAAHHGVADTDEVVTPRRRGGQASRGGRPRVVVHDARCEAVRRRPLALLDTVTHLLEPQEHAAILGPHERRVEERLRMLSGGRVERFRCAVIRRQGRLLLLYTQITGG